MPHNIVLMLAMEVEDDRLDPAKLAANMQTEAHRLRLIEIVKEALPGDYTTLAMMGQEDANRMLSMWMQVQAQLAGQNRQMNRQQPRHWMTEKTGRMRHVVNVYLDDRVLFMNTTEIAIMKEYLAMWMSADWPGDGIDELRASVKEIKTKGDLKRWFDRAALFEIDPL